MPRKRHEFEEGKIYHLSNIGNTGEEIFISDQNYEYFLQKLTARATGVFEIIGYSLIRNQYHLIIKIKPEKTLFTAYATRKKIPIHLVVLDKEELSMFISQEIGNFLNAYAKAFNKEQGRKGSLFRENFRKVPLDQNNVQEVLEKFKYLIAMQNNESKVDTWKYCSHFELNNGCRRVIDWKKCRKYYTRRFETLAEKENAHAICQNIMIL